MLKRAFPNVTTSHQYHSVNHTRWKVRLCYGFFLLILITLAVLLLAWNILCGLPSMNPLLTSEGVSTRKLGVDDLVRSVPLENDVSKRHLVQIYYEVLCPDSRYFILKEFNPVYALFKDHIQPSFVPFGKASVSFNGEQMTFECQHGEQECQGNMIHSCAIAHVTNEEALVAYIGCMINNNRNPEEVGKKCAQQLQIDWNPIEKCWKGTEGPQLLKTYGEMTQALKPPVSFIPTILIDSSQDGQRELLKGLKPFLCKKILTKEKPKDCVDGLGKWRFN